jgi:hypothetical protein
VLLAEGVQVVTDPLEQRPLADVGLDVRAVELLDVRRVERRRHRLDRAQRVGDRLQMPRDVEHAGLHGGDVRVVRERVPRPEDDVVERRERHEVADQRDPVLGALAESDRAHLRQRAHRFGHAAADQLDAGDEGGRHRPEPDAHHPELALGGRDRRRRQRAGGRVGMGGFGHGRSHGGTFTTAGRQRSRDDDRRPPA